MAEFSWAQTSFERLWTVSIVSHWLQCIEWNSSKQDTVGPSKVVQYSKVSLPKEFCLVVCKDIVGQALSCSQITLHTMSNAQM